MKSIVKILMERDDLTQEEAKQQVDDCRETILNSPDEDPSEIIQDELGLEPDYLEQILG